MGTKSGSKMVNQLIRTIGEDKLITRKLRTYWAGGAFGNGPVYLAPNVRMGFKYRGKNAKKV